VFSLALFQAKKTVRIAIKADGVKPAGPGGVVHGLCREEQKSNSATEASTCGIGPLRRAANPSTTFKKSIGSSTTEGEYEWADHFLTHEMRTTPVTVTLKDKERTQFKDHYVFCRVQQGKRSSRTNE
jgi:hypothetical protein